jgi:hypothetical protein
MQKRRNIRLSFEVDKLTNSIENVLTGETFETEIVRLRKEDAKIIEVSEWLFDWSRELRDGNREVFKLTTRENPSVIQALMSFSDQQDHIFVHLIENAPFNVGRKKMYRGVAETLSLLHASVPLRKVTMDLLHLSQKLSLSSITKTRFGQNEFGGIGCSWIHKPRTG